ncbi:protein ABHD11-like [Uloborus diversus]|uniref:protein ABHD11-like n=1 Tax=Uloborus diversus TaxID=327109 RepID=UPI00240A2863|nr:protein ABHD11-like [Uloborus diversus]
MSSHSLIKLAYKFLTPASESGDTLPPIIFLHGVTLSKEHWFDIPQVICNETRRKAYVLDARNHGDSEWSDEFNFEIIVDDLLHFMDQLNIPKAFLIGHSMGGITAYKTALKKPDRVEGIIVEDMLVRKLPKHLVEGPVAYIKAARRAIDLVPPDFDENGAHKCIFSQISRDIPSGFVNEEQSPYLDLKRSSYGRWAFKGNMEVLQKALENEQTLMEDPSGEFRGPACFIYGGFSPFLGGKDEYHTRQFFPRAEFVTIEEAYHDIHKEHPLKFTEIVLNFLLKM